MSLSNKGGWTPPAPGDISPPDLPETHDDMHTQANVEDFSPQHIEIDWLVDWDKKILQGQVIHTLSLAKENVGTITLDTSYLEIRKVSLIKENDSDEELSFKLEKRRGTLGSALSIQIGKHRKGDKIKVRIYYETTPKCTALGWLNAEQTESKNSPSHKITYTSQVRSKYPVLMSALADGSVRATDKEIGDALVRDSNNDIATYRFRQPVGVPTYLIAIVGGNLVFRSLGPRVGVWAEPTMIDRVEWEFKEDADRFLKAAEETISPYSWTRYDSVVLPPSFPYGGMENANLTTLTPTLICGDRNQTDVLLHELSHSWSGNLTSCANWSSFWLNEGINVWIERLLLSVVHGPAGGDAIRGLHYTIGQKAFHDAVDQFKDTPRFQRLVPLMKEGEDPDDAFSSIPYEKGSTFLLYLERLVGGLDVFLPFIRSYFKAFYNRSVSTEEWKQHLFDFYKGNDTIIRNLEGVNWDAWFHGEGKALPSPVPFDESLAEQVYSLVQRWTDVIQGHKVDGSFSPADIAGWDPNQVVLFLARLQSGPKVPAHVASKLDDTYSFGSHKNTEIRCGFYGLALHDVNGKYAQAAAEWVSRQGRMKYCRPLYRALNKVDPELAKRTFRANRSFYHPIAAAMIAIDLQLHVEKAGIAKRRKLISICGSTGTGKSQLAVEIARHLRQGAEIISADSMQLYKGLDTITNKVTTNEMDGIPHHLMNVLDPSEGEEFDVQTFVKKAHQIEEDITSRGKVPVIVGGTGYYIQHYLFPGELIPPSSHDTDFASQHSLRSIVENCGVTLDEASWRLLRRVEQNCRTQGGTANDDDLLADKSIAPYDLWYLLHTLDPEMARRWHFRDGRKILRSLSVLIETGKRHSQWIDQQMIDRDKQQKFPPDEQLDCLIIWITCEGEKLRARLDGRVEKMVKSGLLDEILQLRQIERKQGRSDYTRGIFQAIGYKEFSEFLTLCEERNLSIGEDLLQKISQDNILLRAFQKSLEAMKIGTHQYAKRQTSWLRNKLIPELQFRNRVQTKLPLLILDGTDENSWKSKVSSPALHAVNAFLQDLPVPHANAQLEQIEEDSPRENVVFDICPICTLDEKEPVMVLRSQWKAHNYGKTHRAGLRARGLIQPQGRDDSLEAKAKRAARQALREEASTHLS